VCIIRRSFSNYRLRHVGLTGRTFARGGRACLAGWLGGLEPIAEFNPPLQIASGVYLTFLVSFVFEKPGCSLSDVPLQAIAADVEAGRYRAKPSRVFRFEDIQEARHVMESNEAKGKMVMVL
jgi:NADPH:quinone reductase-like Zn-dependent oxidoreductase